MKKKFLLIIIFTILISLMVSPFLGQGDIIKETKQTSENNFKEETTLEEIESSTLNNTITDTQIVGTTQSPTEESTEEETTITYPNLYTDFTQEEIYIIQRVVETETYTADIESKMNVASVVFNRLNHPNNKYGDDIIAIITAPNQFAYWRTEISETTIQAVENVYKYGDTTGGCMAYRSDECPQYWYGWEYQFTDNVGHHFYAEIKEGE